MKVTRFTGWRQRSSDGVLEVHAYWAAEWEQFDDEVIDIRGIDMRKHLVDFRDRLEQEKPSRIPGLCRVLKDAGIDLDEGVIIDRPVGLGVYACGGGRRCPMRARHA